MANTTSAFVPNSGLTPDGTPNVTKYDSDTYLISQWYEGYTLNLGIYASQYSGNMWTLESVYAINSNLDALMGVYGVNVRFDVTDNFSSGTLFTNMYSGNDSMTGNKFNDVIKSGAGNDILVGNAGNDKLYGESDNDLLKGGAGKDTLDGGSGTDTADYSDKTTAVKVTLNGSTNDTVYVNNSAEDTIKNIENINGGSGADTITGDAYANTLKGNSGNDTLNGGAGADTLIGGTGTDKLFGGVDKVRDVFDFNSIAESKVGTARDKVYNFLKGIDDLDLKPIDANTKVSGDQAFKFAGTKAGANSLWYAAKDVDGSTATKDIIVYGDVNGDAKADFEIGLVGVTSIAATDFVL
jgi:Ca2+-binding RTX toxin-like protein